MYVAEVLKNASPIPTFLPNSKLPPKNGKPLSLGYCLEDYVNQWLATATDIQVLNEPPVKKIKNYKILKDIKGANIILNKKTNTPFSDLDVIFQVNKPEKRPKAYLGEVKLNKFGKYTRNIDTFYYIGEKIFQKDFAGLCLFTPITTHKKRKQVDKVSTQYKGLLEIIDIAELTISLTDYLSQQGYYWY